MSKEVSRPERRLTLLFIATGGTFTSYATILGALELFDLSGISVNIGTAFEAHPYLQIFGFLAEFVVGVGYSLLPLFKSRRMSNVRLGNLTYACLTLGNILLLASSFILSDSILTKTASVLVLLSSILFALDALSLLSTPSKLLAEAEPFMILAVVSFVLLSTEFVLGQFSIISEDIFSVYFLYLSLLGFVGSMIFGVVLRTIAFRLTTYRKRLSTVTLALQAGGVAIIFVSIFLSIDALIEVAGILFLAAAISMIFTARIFERSKKLLPLGAKPAAPNRIQSYSDACEISAMSWLVLGCILGVGFVASKNFFARDLFIHVLAIGFIGSTIIAYSPVLLPGVLTSRGPSEKLTLWPLALLDIGLAFRVAGDTYASVNQSGLPVWEPISGVLILAALMVFGYSLHARSMNVVLR
ncbi:MAG: hypothetical protein JRN52_00200 [Nitrososphaerota archaeon]|nr:hypothetical protein [Nitrososphaerota archaeon]